MLNSKIRASHLKSHFFLIFYIHTVIDKLLSLHSHIIMTRLASSITSSLFITDGTHLIPESELELESELTAFQTRWNNFMLKLESELESNYIQWNRNWNRSCWNCPITALYALQALQ